MTEPLVPIPAIDVRDVLDALWLASLLSPGPAREKTGDDGSADLDSTAGALPTDQSTTGTAVTESSPAGASSTDASQSASTSDTSTSGGLFTANQKSTGETIAARPLRIPAGTALPNALPIVRALRSIPARRPSRTDFELDEDATVDASAQGLGIVPVLHRRLERWFDAALVVDHSPSSEIWAQTVTEIERVLGCAGTFRDVRTYRLQRTPTLQLQTESGSRVRPGILRDPTGRRVIFVFSPGVSEAWSDGTFGQLFETWSASTPVALLHALPRRLWSGTRLGEPPALVSSPVPGAPNIGLVVRRGWWARTWRVEGRRTTLPVLALDPDSAQRWAEMFAARRGRSSLAFLVASEPQSDVVLPGQRPTPSIADRVSGLSAKAPEAFSLAVRLAVGPFTMPIVQLVQASLSGREADHAQVAEVMLSGLVTRLTPVDAPVAPEQVVFQFVPEASALLLESLRRDDARKMAALLQGYIEQHYGTPRDQLVLINDPQGPMRMPAAAQPFARLSEQFVRWLTQSAPKLASGVRPTIRVNDTPDLPPPAVSTPAAVDEPLPQRVTTLFWTFAQLPRTDVPWMTGLRILWVDDRPSNNSAETRELEEMGAEVMAVRTTEEALSVLSSDPFDIVISDMSRPEGSNAGLELLQALRRRNDQRPFVIYAARWSVNNRDKARKAGAFGATNAPWELYTFMVEAAVVARVARFVNGYGALVAEQPSSVASFDEVRHWMPTQAAEQVAKRAVGTDGKASAAFVEFVASITQSAYVQLFKFDSSELTLDASRIAKGLTTYQVASMTGLIGRAAVTGKTWWAPVASEEPGYIAAEPTTRSELVIPWRDPDGRIGFVLNIERNIANAFSATQIRWLEAFVRAFPFAETAAEAVTPPTRDVDLPASDYVFTAYVPRLLVPGQAQQLAIFASPPQAFQDDEAPAELADVESRAAELLGDLARYNKAYTGIVSPISRGELVQFFTASETIEFEPKGGLSTSWAGGSDVAQFIVRVPIDSLDPVARARIDIHRRGVFVASVNLLIQVKSSDGVDSGAAASARADRRVYPSYAETDAIRVRVWQRVVALIGQRIHDEDLTVADGDWDTTEQRIREADIFQLFWSRDASASARVEREWRFALSLNRPGFVRPVYWEDPMPEIPFQLRNIQFSRITPGDIPSVERSDARPRPVDSPSPSRSEESPQRPPASSPDERPGTERGQVVIYVATTRRREAADRFGEMFGTERSEELNLIRATVAIPPSHRLGDVETPSALRLQFRESPKHHVVVVELDDVDRPRFGSWAPRSRGPSDPLICVAGYNMTFDGNVRRAAVTAWDLEWSGPMILMDWPSSGNVTGLLRDLETAEWAAPSLESLLKLARPSRARRRFLIASDVGCTLALSGLERATTTVEELILIQPLMDREVLAMRLRRIASKVKRVTIYVPQGLVVSALFLVVPNLFGQRADDYIDLPNVDVVAGSGAEIGWSAENLADIRAVLNGVSADQRSGLERLGRSWRFA